MKRRLLWKIASHLSHGSPSRFFYNEKIKAAWAHRMASRSSSPYEGVPRSRSYHWDMDARGHVFPCDLWRWAFMFEFQHKWRVLKQTKVDAATVSTVFLGTDHSWGGDRPILFESMIFGGPLDMEQERYASREEALAGHEALVLRCRTKEEAP